LFLLIQSWRQPAALLLSLNRRNDNSNVLSSLKASREQLLDSVINETKFLNNPEISHMPRHESTQVLIQKEAPSCQSCFAARKTGNLEAAAEVGRNARRDH
jgi:hypothetical protein